MKTKNILKKSNNKNIKKNNIKSLPLSLDEISFHSDFVMMMQVWASLRTYWTVVHWVSFHFHSESYTLTLGPAQSL